MHPSNPLRQLVQDANGSVPSLSSTGQLTPSIVNNIPVQTPSPVSPTEDDELDQIMRDVGKELKTDQLKPSKRHFSLFKRKSKNHPKAQAHTANLQNLAPTNQTQLPPTPAPPLQTVQTAKAAKASKAPRTNSAPAFAITTTVAVTAALIVAAWYAYK